MITKSQILDAIERHEGLEAQADYMDELEQDAREARFDANEAHKDLIDLINSLDIPDGESEIYIRGKQRVYSFASTVDHNLNMSIADQYAMAGEPLGDDEG